MIPTPHAASHYLLIDAMGDGAALSLPVVVIPAPSTPEGRRRLAAAGGQYGIHGDCETCGDAVVGAEPVALVYGATDAPMPEAVHLSCLVLSDHLGFLPAYVVEGQDVAVEAARHCAEAVSLAW